MIFAGRYGVGFALLPLMALPFVGSCSGSGDRESDSTSGSEIHGGAPVGYADVRAVGRIINSLGGECSGSYIGNRTVLTAGHCLVQIAQGCAVGFGSTLATMVFADQNGDPTSAQAQTIDVIGAISHPDAVGDRVTSCTTPPRPPPCGGQDPNLPDYDPHYYDFPSCALIQQCPGPITGYMGLHRESELLVLQLRTDPVGIQPLRVFIGAGVGDPARNLYGYKDLQSFLSADPTVSIVGYGLGSTEWSGVRGRNMTTTTLTEVTMTLDRPVACNGTTPPGVVAQMLLTETTSILHGWADNGDSGGPVLAGSGTVPGGLLAPTALPGGSGFTGRFIVGVFSAHGDEEEAALATPTWSTSNGQFLMAAVGNMDTDVQLDSNDNCASVSNPDQLNCNVDAEQDRQADTLGDACDPVPCPQFKSPVTVQVPVASDITSCAGTVTTRDLRREIHPKLTDSRHPQLGTSASDTSNETRFRFCQFDAVDNSFCTVGQTQRTDGNFTENPSSFTHWFPTKLTSAAGGIKTYNYPSTPSVETWDYWTDRASWIASNWINNPGGLAKPPGTAETAWTTSSKLKGVFGLRGNWSTMLGHAGSPQNGVHSSPTNGEGLARHYEAHEPDAVVEEIYYSCLFACTPPCDTIDPTVPIYWCPGCVQKPPGYWYSEDPVVGGVLAKASNGSWGLITPENRVLLSSPFFGSLETALNDATLKHVRASEPFASGGRRNVQSVFLQADGRKVNSGVMAVDGQFLVDRGVESPTTTITARTGWTSAYSQRLDAAFVIGGTIGATPTSEIWVLPLGGVPYLLTVGGYAPVDARAAVVSAADGALWVLDSPLAGANDRRLVRIDLAAAVFQVVWSGTATTSWNKTWLMSERNGNVLAVSKGPSTYCSLRFGATPFKLGTEAATLKRTDTGLLTGPPLIDGAGYLFVKRSGSAATSTRVTTLVDQSGGSPNIATCL